MNTKPKTKRLTISLLCCGRPDTTERCLKSIMPIREAVDSEIQIIDTGCQPNTRAIVDKYADEVFEFTWCNDFAKARNFQMDQANGEFFLYLDDDEYFENPQQIIDFFNSDDCYNYDLGGYYQRNYVNFDGTEWADVMVSRFHKMTSDTCFSGKIHEYMKPTDGRTMVLDVYAGHYGYCYKNPEDNFKHSMRNIPLLIEMMEEEPDELRWPAQLAQEYRAISKFDELLELCQTNLDKTAGNKNLDVGVHRATFAAGRVVAELEKHMVKELKAHWLEVKNDPTIAYMGRAKVAMYTAKEYFIEGDYEGMLDPSEYYLKAYEFFQKNVFERVMQGRILVFDCFDDVYMDTTICQLMIGGMKNKDFSQLSKYYRKVNWDSQVVHINRAFISELVKNCCEYKDKKELKGPIKMFNKKIGLKNVLCLEINDVYANKTIEELKNLKGYFSDGQFHEEFCTFMDLKIHSREMMLKEDWTGFEEMYDAVVKYVDLTEKWFKLAKDGDTQINPNDLPFDVRLAASLTQFEKLYDTNPKEALVELKRALPQNPFMKDFIAALSKEYGKKLQLERAKASDPAKFEEMYNLEEAVLRQISELENAGHSADAQTTRGQLEAILMQTYGIKTLH